MNTYERTTYIAVNFFPCEWFLWRTSQFYRDGAFVERWQFGCFAVERVTKGTRFV